MIDAALELFGTQGYSSTSIERLCATANVSTRSFYEDIGSREALLIALVDRMNTAALQRLDEVLERTHDEPLVVRVVETFRAFLSVTCRDRRAARVFYLEVVGVSPLVEEWRRAQRRQILTLITSEAQRAAERGEAESRGFHLFSLAVIGAVNSLAQEMVHSTVPGEAISVDEICDEIAYLIESGLSTRTPVAPS
ncbi:TetR/AcrR family transcriptional regulator [Nocardia camponoti]|uniref:TetR family transcriptional regulator n=1 Tax=Nocardia camponoti TaxID=1616106 RepID=A0A917V8V9_9NOCA|nr:TetR/AcrR family transcriptional regulator [Nocardia camponoti]GGK51315.1 TetR family transcriptional regulator [Nocardia camponoti]